MRISIMGDFQLTGNDRALTARAMEDIRACHPDLLITLGDYGSPDKIGFPQGVHGVHPWLLRAECPVRPILGNHDLQREVGKNVLPHGTMESAVRECFRVSDTFAALEFADFRLLLVSLDDWAQEPPYSPNECHVNDEHFVWIERVIDERPGVPAVVMTHAPAIFSGLKVVPDVHVRATNAYMDQNTDPHRWARIAERPEILLWLSAHYHLGHDHPDSLRIDRGLCYAMAGVHNEITRDGQRHTRVLDISGGALAVRTLDHGSRELREKPDVVLDMNAGVALRREMSDTPFRNTWDGVKYVYAGDNRLWEKDPLTGAVLGTLHYSDEPLLGFAVCGNTVFRWTEDALYAVDADCPWRFSREKSPEDDHRREARMALPGKIQCWKAIGDELSFTTERGKWIAAGDARRIHLGVGHY